MDIKWEVSPSPCVSLGFLIGTRKYVHVFHTVWQKMAYHPCELRKFRCAKVVRRRPLWIRGLEWCSWWIWSAFQERSCTCWPGPLWEKSQTGGCYWTGTKYILCTKNHCNHVFLIILRWLCLTSRKILLFEFVQFSVQKYENYCALLATSVTTLQCIHASRVSNFLNKDKPGYP